MSTCMHVRTCEWFVHITNMTGRGITVTTINMRHSNSVSIKKYKKSRNYISETRIISCYIIVYSVGIILFDELLPIYY